MTFWQALRILDVRPDASRDEARRAYLRLLKTRTPEKDPEGFRELREAYEAVKDRLVDGPVVVPAAAPAAAGPGPVLEHVRVHVLGSEAEPEEAAAADPDPDPENDPENDPEPENENVLENENDPETPRPNSHPPVPDDHLQLRSLFSRAAQATDPAQWTLMAAAFDAVAARSDAPPPPVDACLRMLLRLHQENDVLSAGKLERSFRAWLTSVEGGAGTLKGAMAARWKLVSELGNASSELPPPVRTALASALLGGDLAAAKPALEAYRLSNQDAAGKANATLHIKAPTIADAFPKVLYIPTGKELAALFPPRPRQVFTNLPPPRPQRSWGGVAAAPIIIVAIAMLRVCASTSSRSSFTYTPPPHYDLPQFNELPDFSHLYDKPTDYRFQIVALEAGQLADSAGEHGNEMAAAAAGRLREAANASDCERMISELRLLDQTVKRSDDWATFTHGMIRGNVIEVCPSSGYEAPPPDEPPPPKKKKHRSKPQSAAPEAPSE